MRTVLLALVMVTAGAHGQSAPDGQALYKEHCATCHDAGMPRAAARSVLEKLSPDSIRTTLDVGSMVQQAAALLPAQKDAIIAYLTRDSAPQPAVAVNRSARRRSKHTPRRSARLTGPAGVMM